jgi:hypothetical protein
MSALLERSRKPCAMTMAMEEGPATLIPAGALTSGWGADARAPQLVTERFASSGAVPKSSPRSGRPRMRRAVGRAAPRRGSGSGAVARSSLSATRGADCGRDSDRTTKRPLASERRAKTAARTKTLVSPWVQTISARMAGGAPSSRCARVAGDGRPIGPERHEMERHRDTNSSGFAGYFPGSTTSIARTWALCTL